MEVTDLAALLREAEEQHGHYEPTAPRHHWWDWYAAYVVARSTGAAPEDAFRTAVDHLEGVRP